MPSLAALLLPLITIPIAPIPHVRPETAALRTLVGRASAQSPLVHTLIDRLDHSEVVVYVRYRPFGARLLDGRLGWLSTVGRRRYLIIELACDRNALVQMATLGHELYHAIEIAGEPSIVDARTLARFYARVGTPSPAPDYAQTFETRAAAGMGARVRQELLTPPARSTNGS
jgi:hypothetical protein